MQIDLSNNVDELDHLVHVSYDDSDHQYPLLPLKYSIGFYNNFLTIKVASI